MTTSSAKKTQAMKKNLEKDTVKKVEKVQEEKHVEETKKEVETIENGTWIDIMLSWDILMWGLLYRKQCKYTVQKMVFTQLEYHCRILWVAMKIL